MINMYLCKKYQYPCTVTDFFGRVVLGLQY